MLLRSRTAAVLLIVVGALLLVSNLGWAPEIGSLFQRWWPLLLVIAGIWIIIQRQRRWW